MSNQIEVRPEISEKITALARARGISIDQLLQEMLEPVDTERSVKGSTSPEQFERDLDAMVVDDVSAPYTYRGTYPREDIYQDHD